MTLIDNYNSFKLNFIGVNMPPSKKYYETALASAKKRAVNLREKIKVEQPMVIASTIAGGYLSSVLESNTPDFISNTQFGKNPELLVGAVAVGYGLFSRRSGQAEKVITALGTGMLTVYTYKFAQSQAQTTTTSARL